MLDEVRSDLGQIYFADHSKFIDIRLVSKHESKNIFILFFH